MDNTKHPDMPFMFDLHGHPDRLFPLPMRLALKKTMPEDVRLNDLRASGVNGYVINALGDRNTFFKFRVDEWKSVKRQVSRFKRRMRAAGASLLESHRDVADAMAGGAFVMALGVEGADFLEGEIGRIDEVYADGVRVLQLLHYRKNLIGSIALGWGGRVPAESENTGLTEYGVEVVRRCNELGIILDLSHSDEQTLFSAVDESVAPVMISHTGSKAMMDFPRYVSDDAARAIVAKGGLLGLWLFRGGPVGMQTLDDFDRHLMHWMELIGPEYIGIGTDINGVPANCEGFESIAGFRRLIDRMETLGLNDATIAGITGGNFARIFEAVESFAGATGERSG